VWLGTDLARAKPENIIKGLVLLEMKGVCNSREALLLK